jgi:hypothetical protein
MITAQKRGEIRRDINSQSVLYFLNKMIEIEGDVRVINMYESIQSLTADLINLFFYGILTKKNGG